MYRCGLGSEAMGNTRAALIRRGHALATLVSKLVGFSYSLTYYNLLTRLLTRLLTYIRRGHAEIVALALEFFPSARATTFSEACGIGDLMLTCRSVRAVLV